MGKKRMIGLLLVVLLIFGGCSGKDGEAGKEAETNNSMVFGMSQFQANMDPAADWNGWYVYMYGIGETLVGFDMDMGIEPKLAKEWERVDATTWSFQLRDDVIFHNGEQMDAQDVKYSFDRALERNPRATDLTGITEVEAVAEDQILVKTEAANEAFLGAIADPMFIILSKDQDPTAIETNPVATGPYKMESVQGNEKVVVNKHEAYWKEPPNLDQITFRYIKDGNTRAMALQNGEIDGANYLPINQLAAFREKEDYRVLETESLRVVMNFFHFENPHLKDPLVRKALTLAVNAEEYGEDLLDRSAVPAEGPFPSSLPFGGEGLNKESFDPQKSKELLAEAGYEEKDGKMMKDGQPLVLRLAYYTTRAELPILAEAMQAQLKEIGVDVELESYEGLYDVLSSGDYDMALYSVNTATTGDPKGYLETYFTTEGSTNFARYSNEEVDRLVEELDEESDPEKRHQTALEVQQILLDDAASMFLLTPKLNIVVQSDITGIEMYPVEYYLITSGVDRLE